MPMNCEYRVERPENPVRRPDNRRQKPRKECPQIHSSRQQITEPWQEMALLDFQHWKLPLKAVAVAIEHNPRERLIRIQHIVPFRKTPGHCLLVVWLRMNPAEEDPRKRSVGLIHHSEHSTGHQHAARFAEEALHVRNVMEHMRQKERANGTVRKRQLPPV